MCGLQGGKHQVLFGVVETYTHMGQHAHGSQGWGRGGVVYVNCGPIPRQLARPVSVEQSSGHLRQVSVRIISCEYGL